MQHLKLFVEACLRGRGLDKNSFEMLMMMVKEDRDVAMELHDLIDNAWLHPSNVYVYRERTGEGYEL